MLALDYCHQKAAESHSSFLSGFRFLSVEKRNAITVLYAFCRELDDVVDGCTNPNVAQITLNWWRSDLEKVFNNEMPEHPVHQALKDIRANFDLPKNEFEALIDGMQMDLENIIRDVGEDARQGRIYLPIEEMQKFDVPANVIMQCKPTDNFAKLMQFQVNRARETYREAMLLLPAEDKKSQKVGLIMAAIYYALLNEINRDGAQNVLTYKIAIPSPRKKRIALKTWLFGFKP